ncbi:acetate--CoA ligase family protein [Longivirga aurantiaca]|uniref:Acetate--CoA ligase family protein n=1 Tax=Longivirga aurantiaca TaxID=1837743 RepID=A0ABW1T653_9ACTN
MSDGRLLEALFAPKRIALVGASDRPGSLGALLAANLASFPGEVLPVRAGESLRDLGVPVDLAVVAVPAAAAPQVAADAAAAGVTAMIVLSGGFAESGPDGALLQEEMLRAAAPEGGSRVRVVGPNCFGVQNCDLPLNASIARGTPVGGGGISVVSQSGAYGMAVHDLAHEEHVRFAKVCAPGNTSDVSVAELLEALGEDPATTTVCMLLESVADGRELMATARAVAARVPVFVLKTGRSEAGARAATSHTAALASSAAVWRGALHQAGLVEVRSGQELLDAARAVDGQPLPAGDRVAIITNSGGTGVELADLLADEGLAVPALSPALQERVRALLPAYASPVNPVDVTTAWSLFPTIYPALVDLLARSGEVDAVVAVLLQRSATDPATVQGVAAAVQALRADGVAVPVHVCWVAPRSADDLARELQGAGVPVLPWPPRAARALGLARRAARARDRLARGSAAPRTAPGSTPGPDVDVTDPEAAARLLRGFGVEVVASVECRTAEEAEQAASFPAVVKVGRAAHRTELDGVRLGLSDRAEVRAAAAELLLRSPTVLVSPQLAGVEVAVGAVRDPDFGPVVMVGAGGIWVETLDDTAFALAPLGLDDARELVAGLRIHAVLAGGRGQEPADLEALARLLVAAGDALVGLPDVAALDLNPVLVSAQAAVAVDWKLLPGGSSARVRDQW